MNNLAGDVISNAPSTTATSAIYNGPASPNDVIYNLAAGSSLAVASGAANDGILATKTTGTGGIYIRSAATISDGTANTTAGTGINVTAGSSGKVVVRNEAGGTIRKATGISVTDSGSSTVDVINAGTINSTTAGVALTHNGTGTVKLTNSGAITSTTAGVSLTTTGGSKNITVDSTGGTITATGGYGITLSNNILLNLINGTIATTGAAVGLNINTANAGTQTLTGTIFNLGGTGSAIAKGAPGSVNLSNTQFNATSGTVFTTLAGLNFLQGLANNAINLTGTGAVTGISSTASLDLSPAYLDINVNNAAATGISTSGATGGAVTVGPNTTINASGGAAAITFGNSVAESLTNNGLISGSVSMGNSGNTIVNNRTLGSLTSGTGADTLTLNNGSVNTGIIDLGAGNNIVNVNDGATIYAVNTGIGNDTFNVNDLTNGSITSLGVLNAGGGTNTLNLSNSTRNLNSATRLQNFANINLTNNSNITLNDSNTITSGNVNLAAANTLSFGDTYNGAFNAVLGGSGNAQVLSAGNVTLSAASTFAGNWQINSGGTLNANAFNQLGTASIDLNGVLNFSNSGTFNNVLTGTGLLNINDTGGAFDFGADAGSAFAGTVDISNATFNLSGLNSSALNDATLRNSTGGVITLDNGTHNVGDLVFNGGTLQFSPGGLISTGGGTGSGLLAVTGNSVIQADPTLLTAGNILDLNAGTFTNLVQSGNALSAADLARLQLQDLLGNNLLAGTTANYIQGGQVVAVNTYDFALVSNYGFSNLGLSIYEQLTQSDLQAGQTLTLTSNGASNTTLTSQLTGAGNLAIGADNTALTLSNELNDYTGTTTVNAGSLTLGTNNALGNTSLLDVVAGATVNLAGHEQTVTALSNAGTVGLAGGTLNVTNGGTSSVTGGLTGAGALNINGGTFTVTGANSGLSAQTTVASGGIATLSGAGNLGSGGIEVDGTLNLNSANPTFSNILSGVGTVNTNAAIGLTGDNSFSGTFDVNTSGSLTVSSAANLGSAEVDLTNASAQLLLNGFIENLGNTLSGVAGSTVQLNNNSSTTLSGANSGFAGLFDLTGNSTLTASQNMHLGSSSVNIGSDSTLTYDTFAGGALTALNNALNGAGNWVLRNSNINLSGNSNAAGFSGLLDINTGSSLTLNAATTLDANTVLNVNDATSTLNINNTGAFALNNSLTGAGQVNVDTANNAFSFGVGAGTAFTGNVTLNNTTFSLADTNASALTLAGLTLGNGSVTTVGSAGTPGTETLRALTLNGGTLNFTGGAPLSSAESTITTQTLTASSGTINVVGGGSWDNTPPVVPPNLSILEQNRGATAMQLISATTATGADTLTLMIDGVAVTPLGLLSAINQNAQHVADATYHYSLSNTNAASDFGLYLNYDLSAINLLLDNPNALIIATDASPDANKNLTAQLTGVGGIVLDATNGALTVTNSQNSYTGSTEVTGGNVLLGSNNAFGATSLLTVASGASFNTNNFSQTVGALTNLGTVTLDPGVLSSGLLTNTGVLDLAGGTLNLSSGGTSSGVGGLTGAGTLNVNGGDLALSAANSGLSATTHIASGASVTSSAANALGISAVEVGGQLNLNAADTLANVLSGAGTINTDAAVTLSGSNTFSGTHAINADGALTVSTVNNLGTSAARVDLTDATAQLLLNGLTGTLANTLSGIAGSTVQLNNAAATTLTGINSGFAGLFDLIDSSTLTVSQSANLGSGGVSIGSGSTLNVNAFEGGALTALNNALSGAGNWVLRNSNINLSGNSNAAGFSGLLDINTGASLTLNGTTALNVDTVLNVNDATSTLNINNTGDFALNNALTGAGQVNVDTANNAFSFGVGAGTAFTGNVTLNNTTFSLADTNASALALAGLTLGNGSDTTVGVAGTPGTETLRALTLNGGTLNFTGGAPLSSAESTITTQTLAASSGTINLVGGSSWDNTPPVVPPNLSILEQNRGATAMQLISATTASGADTLTLTIDGVAVTPQGLVSAINQNAQHVADATYNYALSNTNAASAFGLYLNYGLSAINLLLDNPDALIIATDASPDSNKNLTAQLTGVGGIVLDATNGALTVTNSQNSYTGSTQVTGGTVLLGSNNALGATSLLTVASGATFNTNNFSQTVGALTNLGTVTLDPGVLSSGLLTNTGVLDLAGGTLNLSSGGTSTAPGGLTGAGTLNVNGGDLALSAANGGLSATTHILLGASVTASAANALGTSAVDVGGQLNLNAADTLANVLSGAGTVNTDAAVTLSGSNTFSGTHDINANGALTVSTVNNLGTSAARVDLTDATAQLLLNGLTGTLANTLSGVAGATVQLNNAAATTLTGTNSSFAGLFDLIDSSTLTVSQSANLGTGGVSIGSGSILNFNAFEGGALTALNNALSGAGNWVLRNSNINLSGSSNAAGFSGLLDINTGASLTLNGTTALNVDTVLNVNDATSTLNINNTGAFALNNSLTGAGQVNVDTANNAFSFGVGAGTAFTGNVTLNNTTFSLADTNASALALAGLTLGAGSDTTVGVAGTPATETLRALTLNGGTLNFTGGAPLSIAESTITTQTLTASSGTINVVGAGSWDNVLPVVPPNLSILDQNRGASAMQLISANTASGAGNLTLMINGVAVAPGQGVVSGIDQNAVHVADATYSYLLSNTNNLNATGLYLNYGLSMLNLLQDNPNALVIATDASPDSNKNLTAQLTGVGGIVLDATNGALTVTNSQNSYTGSTQVTGGNVILGSNNALGATSQLTVASGAGLNSNTFSQTVGALINLGTVTLNTGVLSSGLLTNSGAIDLAGGILNLSLGGTSSGVGGLSGAGTLNVNGGDLALSAANGGLSATTHIASGASITASAANALGTSAVEVGGRLNLNAADTLANVLSGAGTVNTDAAVTLSGSNTFSGTHAINADGALTVSAANNLGTSAASVALTEVTSQLIFSALSGDVANTLSGVADSTVTVNSGANMSLSGNNAGFAGQFGITGNSALSVSQNANLGSGAVDIASGSQLVFNGLTGTLSNTIGGEGAWVLSNGSNVLLNNANASAFIGTVSINGGSVLNLDSIDWFNPAATVDIVSASDTLNISNNGDFTLDNRLLGAGVLNINTNNNLFSFGSNVGDRFTGQVNLQNTQFQLSNNNTNSNSNTVLNLEDNSRTSVGDGVQNIGALEMNGGTLIFNNIIDNSGLLTSGGTVAATSINTTGGGTVSVNLPPNVSPSLEGISTLALDTGAIVVDLVTGAATGTGRELTLTDGSNTPIIQDYFEGITNPNSSVVAAMGTFGFGLTTGDQRDGLYVNYSLKSLDLLTSGSDALELVGTASFNGTPGNELFAQITGSGDLAITEADPGAIVVLSGTDNNYTGATWVHAGTVQLNADSALGQTSDLVIDRGAAVDINGHMQTVGALNSAADSLLDLGGGVLTVSNGGVADGALAGAGNLLLSSGTLAVNNNNTGFSGTTTINSGATADVTQAQGLGTGDIAVDGTLHLDGSTGGLATATLVNALQGSGNTLLSDAANVTLSGNNNAYAGTFTTQTGTTLTATNGDNFGAASVLNAGSLVLNTAGDWDLTTPISGSGSIVKQGSGTVHINNSLVSAGMTTVQSGALLVGTPPVNAAAPQAFALALPTAFAAVGSATLTSDVTVQANGTFGGDGQVIGNLSNAGNLVVGRAATGGNYSDFIINGNYVGNGGNVALNTVLAGDDAATDRLVVTGDTSGTSTVSVSNIGGDGAKNINGIQVINVGGNSAGTFTLNGRAQAGVLEYFLYQGTPTDTADGNWYLRSNYQDKVVTYNPESGAFIANIAAANTLFNTRLEDLHAGDARDTGDLSGTEARSSLWLRQVGSRNKFEDASGQLSNSSNRYVAQLGGEVLDTQFTGQDRFGLGVMAGYGRATGTTDSGETSYKSDNSLTGYTVGVYGTWYANASERHSPYVHGWLQYEWFNASVSSSAYDSGNYHLRGVSTSLEGGYPIEIYHGEENQTYITPQAQLTLNGAKMSDLQNNGSLVQQSGNNNLQTRLGAKLSNDTLMGKDQSRILTTYMDLNWIQNTRLPGVSSDGLGVQQTGSRHLVEVKVGAEGKLNNNFSVWGNLTQQIGQKGYDDKAAMLGVKYSF
ncbi:autotransporter outer membrane beta-barrel domain-containing protein [Serratia sp. D1N4]